MPRFATSRSAFATAAHAIDRQVRRWQREGRHARLVRGAARLNSLWQTLCRRVRLARIIQDVRRLPADADPEVLWDFACDPLGGSLDPVQERSEILGLVEIVRGLRPRRVLEIGTATGGTLFLLARSAAPGALIISVDLGGGRKFASRDGGCPRWQVPLLRALGLAGQRIELVRGDSHRPHLHRRVREVLAGEPLDFLFIDGDHRYEGVKQDFEAYGALVRPGGLVALHDIVPDRFGMNGDVHRLWREVRRDYPTRELVADRSRGYGIGIVEC